MCVLERAEGLESTFFLPPADDTTVTLRVRTGTIIIITIIMFT